MAAKRRPTLQKRNKERARQQKQQEKAARRLEAKRQKAQAGSRAEGGEDPDIAGIRPGPQPLPEQWEMEGETGSAQSE